MKECFSFVAYYNLNGIHADFFIFISFNIPYRKDKYMQSNETLHGLNNLLFFYVLSSFNFRMVYFVHFVV